MIDEYIHGEPRSTASPRGLALPYWRLLWQIQMGLVTLRRKQSKGLGDPDIGARLDDGTDRGQDVSLLVSDLVDMGLVEIVLHDQVGRTWRLTDKGKAAL